MISRALEAEILRLHHTEHWPVGTIATQLRVHHATVRRVLAQAGVPVVQKIARPSMVEPYRAFMVETLTKYPTLRASRLYAMVRERGYPGAPDHFRALVARLRPRPAADRGVKSAHGSFSLVITNCWHAVPIEAIMSLDIDKGSCHDQCP
jgi:hypothetical protein